MERLIADVTSCRIYHQDRKLIFLRYFNVFWSKLAVFVGEDTFGDLKTPYEAQKT